MAIILQTYSMQVLERKFTLEQEESIKKWFHENGDEYSIEDGGDVTHACEELHIDVNEDELCVDEYTHDIIVIKRKEVKR